MQTRFCGLRLNIKLALYRAERRSVRLGVEVIPFGRAKESMGAMEKRWGKVFQGNIENIHFLSSTSFISFSALFLSHYRSLFS